MEKKLKSISKQLKGASKLHAGQAKKIDSMLSLKKKTSPALAKISASCKAYANMYAAKMQRKGKC